MGILILRIMFFKTLLMKKFKIINDFIKNSKKFWNKGILILRNRISKHA